MRSYGQYCGVARALDVIGDRWTLLVVRELAAGDARYVDLRDGLHGVATNLLANRLRELERRGVIERYASGPPAPATLYRLSDWGRGLVPVLEALVRWAEPLMADGPAADDERRLRWLHVAAPALVDWAAEPLTVGLSAGDEALTLRVDADGASPGRGGASDADVTIEAADAALAVAVVAGYVPLSDDRLRVGGTRDARRRFSRIVASARARRTEVGGRA